MIPPNLLAEAEAARDTQTYEGDRYAFMAGVRWLFTRLCEMSEGEFDDGAFAFQSGLHSIDIEGLHNTEAPALLEFARRIARHQCALSQAALLKAKEKIAILKDKDLVEMRKMSGYSDLYESWNKERARCERLEKALQTYLDNEYCRETSCPFPMRAMCSNPMHQLARQALSDKGE